MSTRRLQTGWSSRASMVTADLESMHPGDLDNPHCPVAPLSVDYPGASVRPWHHHRRGQLLYAVTGVMHVATDTGTWVVVPQQAVWVPPRIAHQVSHQHSIAMRTLYIDPGVASGLATGCSVVKVTALLRQLILRAMGIGFDYHRDSAEWRMMMVILDELKALQPEPMHLPRPRDPRLLKITDRLLANPADKRSLARWADRSGASERTLVRLFQMETGMTFGQWRERLRLITAIPQLVQGEPVNVVAYNLGYQNPGAFIAMFRRNTGDTPAQYVKQKAGANQADQV